MKIISKFKDYYDGAGQYTDTPHYLRKTVDLNPITEDEKKPRRLSGKYTGVTDSRLLVGFCGKVYPLVKRLTYKDDELIKREFLFTIDEYNKGREKKKRKSFWNKWSVRYGWGKTETVEEFFAGSHSEYLPLFQEHKVPMFLILVKAERIFLNPCLKDVEFYRVMDPYTTYQEIEMFISGVLGTKENDMIEIDDKYRIEAHGYNKESFRMPKGRKKPRGKGNV